MSDQNADKRTVSTDALETLGTGPLGPNEKRDAIHLAVIPARAESGLVRADHVGIDVDALGNVSAFFVVAGDHRAVGIVDPFLREQVKEGEVFWLVVYPRQIKSLRHVWEHPAFPPSRETQVVERVVELTLSPQLQKTAENYTAALQGAAKERLRQEVLVRESEQWIRDFCDDWADCPGYAAVMSEARRHAEGGGQGRNYGMDEYLHFDGRDAHGTIPPEFWDHFENVTGLRVDKTDRATGFSCSC